MWVGVWVGVGAWWCVCVCVLMRERSSFIRIKHFSLLRHVEFNLPFKDISAKNQNFKYFYIDLINTNNSKMTSPKLWRLHTTQNFRNFWVFASNFFGISQHFATKVSTVKWCKKKLRSVYWPSGERSCDFCEKVILAWQRGRGVKKDSNLRDFIDNP